MLLLYRFVTRKKASLYLSKIKLLRFQHAAGFIHVEPKSSLVTDKIQISGNGFKPNVPITIKASVECSVENISFDSFGHYITTKNGEFDLSLSESVGGSYEGIDSMGLLWSMVETGNRVSRMQVNDASISMTYQFSVFGGHVNIKDIISHDPYCTTSIERNFLRKDIKRSHVKIGKIVGTLFTPSGSGPFPAIITLYGSNKRGQVIEDAAAILANNGFMALAVQYFGAEGQPRMYSQEPLNIEQFEKVVDYLIALENCSSVGVYGISKGADIGIAMMSYLPKDKLKAVASINGPIANMATTTTYGEVVVPQLSMSMEKLEFVSSNMIDCRQSWAHPEDEPKTIHPIEFSSGHILFVVALDDHSFRGEEHGDIAEKRMVAVGKKNYEIVKYHGLGHLVDAPFMPVCISSRHPLLQGLELYYGGKDKKLHAMQQEIVWRKIVSFFNKSMKSNDE